MNGEQYARSLCACVADCGAHYIYRKEFYAHGAGEEEEYDYAWQRQP